jgi:hypothetical protein
MATFLDLTDKRFTRLVVIKRAPNSANLANKNTRWYVVCDCGTLRIVGGQCLRSGHTKSCGCLSKEVVRERSLIHGMTRGRRGTPTYKSWSGMIQRCTNSRDKAFPEYGGRGITVCSRWRKSFLVFLSDMGECPPGLSLERRDNNQGYKPNNCYWATRKEQCNNRRSNIVLTYHGKTHTVTQWAERLGMKNDCLLSRLKLGWSVEKTLTTPLLRQKSRIS